MHPGGRGSEALLVRPVVGSCWGCDVFGVFLCARCYAGSGRVVGWVNVDGKRMAFAIRSITMSDAELIKRFEKLEELMQRMRWADKPLTVREAAKYMGVSRSYLYKLTSQGAIPFYKPNGKLIYFKREDLDRWMLRRRSSL